ncbi:MAG: AAA family ATPase, partial [Pseudonocardia sp.]|nr:AAA family ATPase [Pseudonocardia sp.]
MLHGRRAELRELMGATAAAIKGGRGLIALIGGDAGIGKTRLAAEVAERLRADGITVAWAACPRDGGAPPFWPWAQLLDRLGRPAALAAPDQTAADHARFLVVEAVRAALEAVSPVLLVLDDLHWADDASLHLLSALGAHVAAPVLVLGTYRDTEPGGVAAIAAERRLILSGLSADELGPAVAELTGEVLTSGLLGSLHRRTGGNPYFAAEVVRLLRAEGGLQEGALHGVGAVPDGVRSVLERRLDRLPDATETVLRAAAALDAGTTDGVDPILLAAVAGCPPTELEERLRPAVEARLVVVEGGVHRFPHALVGETLGGRTPAAQRLELHRRAAATLGVRAAAGIDDPAGFAHQLLAAARLSGDPDEAAAAAVAGSDAARAAMARTAYEDAEAWLEAALAVLPPDGDKPDRGELLCDLGDAALAAGDTVGSRSAFAAAARHARRHGFPALLAAAALGTTGGQAGFEVDLSDPDRVALLEEALGVVAPGTTVWGALSARLSIALAFTGAEARRRQLAEDAVSTARAADDPLALADALAARCEALAGPDHVRARRAAAEEIIACSSRSRDRTRELLGRRLRVVALAEGGDWVALDGEIESYARLSQRVRSPGSSWYEPLWRGSRAAMRGDGEAEAAHRAELVADVERSGSVNAELLLLTQQLCRAVHAGRPEDVAPCMHRFVELSGYIHAAAYCTQALLAALAGDAAEAARLVEAYVQARRSTARDSEWLPEMVQAGMTAALIGHRDVAAVVYEALEPHAGLFAIEGIFAGTWGCVDAHLGRLARLMGRVEDAEQYEASGCALNAAAGAGVADWVRTWAPTADRMPGALFRLDGEVWTLGYAGRAAQMRDAKGLHDLAALIRH